MDSTLLTPREFPLGNLGFSGEAQEPSSRGMILLIIEESRYWISLHRHVRIYIYILMLIMCHLCYVFCVILLAVYDEKINAKIHTQFSQLPHLTLKNLCVHCFVLFCFFSTSPSEKTCPVALSSKNTVPWCSGTWGRGSASMTRTTRSDTGKGHKTVSHM